MTPHVYLSLFWYVVHPFITFQAYQLIFLQPWKDLNQPVVQLEAGSSNLGGTVFPGTGKTLDEILGYNGGAGYDDEAELELTSTFTKVCTHAQCCVIHYNQLRYYRVYSRMTWLKSKNSSMRCTP